MAPFSIPAPSIIPLRVPVFGGPRAIDTQTKIEMTCETQLEHEIFYTLDGTKPQPYAGIIQGSKLFKYRLPICLPVGKISIKAVALSALVHSMRSSVITKTFEVLPSELDANHKSSSNKKKKAKNVVVGNDKNGVNRRLTYEFDDFHREDIYERTEEFPPHFVDDSSAEDALESPSEACSFVSVQERLNDPEIEDNEEDSFLYETENLSEGENNAKEKNQAFIIDYTRKECDVVDNGHVSENEKHNGIEEKSVYCMKCEALLQHCSSCHALSAITSKFCIQCGEKLLLECRYCKELNSVIAAFCQSCGRKLEVENRRPEQISFSDCSIMAEPQRQNAYVQQSLPTDNKQTQTSSVRREENRASGRREGDRGSARKEGGHKRLPPHSPGRGYWRQQLDYVCNHLKSYAYNNVEFRDSISEPMLSEFQSVEVVKSDEGVSITVVFSPFMTENDAKNSE